MIIIPNGVLTAEITYHRRDYDWLLQEFVIQMDDLYPDYPRFTKFIRFWRAQDLARIRQINIAFQNGSIKYRVEI